MCVRVCRVLGDGSECVAEEKVTNAGGTACSGKFFVSFSFFSPSSCYRAENREEIQTKITPVPLPEKCPPSLIALCRYPPCSEGKVMLRHWVALKGVLGRLTCPPSTSRHGYPGQYLT